MAKAYIVTLNGTDAIVFAENRSKARWTAVRHWKDAYGLARGVWPDRLSIRRSKEHDRHAECNKAGVCYRPCSIVLDTAAAEE